MRATEARSSELLYPQEFTVSARVVDIPNRINDHTPSFVLGLHDGVDRATVATRENLHETRIYPKLPQHRRDKPRFVPTVASRAQYLKRRGTEGKNENEPVVLCEALIAINPVVDGAYLCRRGAEPRSHRHRPFPKYSIIIQPADPHTNRAGNRYCGQDCRAPNKGEPVKLTTVQRIDLSISCKYSPF